MQGQKRRKPRTNADLAIPSPAPDHLASEVKISADPSKDYLPEHERFLERMIDRALEAWTRSRT